MPFKNSQYKSRCLINIHTRTYITAPKRENSRHLLILYTYYAQHHQRPDPDYQHGKTKSFDDDDL